MRIGSLLCAVLLGILASPGFGAPNGRVVEEGAAEKESVERAEALFEEGKLEEASAMLEKLLETTPGDARPYVGLARIHLAYGELDLALERLAAARELDPASGRIHLYTGIALYYKALEGIADQKVSGYVASLLNDAQANLERATKDRPKDLEAHQFLGLVFYYQQDFPAATAAFERAIAVDAEDAFSFFQLGEIERVQENYEKAIPQYERALAAQPQYTEAHRNIGLCREFLGDTDRAAAAYRDAILTSPAYLEPYKDLWRLYSDETKAGKGVKTLEQVAKKVSDESTVHWYLGHFRRRAGDEKGAIREFRRVLEMTPESTAAMLEIGRIHEQAGSFDAALEFFWKGLRADLDADPELELGRNPFFASLLGLSATLGQERRFEDAEELLQKLLKAAPEDGYVWSNLGLVYRDWGKYEKALHAYEKAARLEPYDAQILNDLGVVLDYHFDRRSDAFELYERAVEIEENVDALENLARLYYLEGRYRDSVRMADRGLRLEPERLALVRYREQAIERLPRSGKDSRSPDG